VTQERRRQGADREFCVALNADTGAELWATDVDIARYSSLQRYDDDMDGPRSTPTIDGDRVYVTTSQLKLYCLGVERGNVIWSRDFVQELGAEQINWQNAASPLVVGDLVFINANVPNQRLMAVHKMDGVTVWSGRNERLTHASPVFAYLADVPQVIFLTGSGLVAVVPETGSLLWRLSFSPSGTSTAASPLVVRENVYASAAYGSGTWIARVTRGPDNTFSASAAWRQRGLDFQAHWSTPVQHGGFLYCTPGQSPDQVQLACLDIGGASNRWSTSAVGTGAIGYGSLIGAANVLIVLTEFGELVLVQPNPEAYTEVARLKVLNRYCWNHATLAGGRIYARNTSATSPEIVALDVGSGVAPLPSVGMAARRGPDQQLQLVVSARDGSALDPAHASRLEMLSTFQLTSPLPEWSVVQGSLQPVNGSYLLEIPLGQEPARFLQLRNKDGND
jgi:outer membrane protein assembly factor BamB